MELQNNLYGILCVIENVWNRGEICNFHILAKPRTTNLKNCRSKKIPKLQIHKIVKMQNYEVTTFQKLPSNSVIS